MKEFEYLKIFHSTKSNYFFHVMQAAVSMFGYMTELETVDIAEERTIEAEGKDSRSTCFICSKLLVVSYIYMQP